MTVLNLNNADKLYYGATEVQKLYKGSELLYPPPQIDPFLNDVVVWLKGDDFTDSSPNPKTVNTLASSQLSLDKKYGTSSFDFTLSNSAIYINSNCGLTTLNNVTIEFWAKKTVTPSIDYLLTFNGLIGTASVEDSDSIQHRAANTFRIFSSDINNTISINNNTWNHYAFVFTTGNIKVYLDGVLVSNLSRTLPTLNTNAFYLGTGYSTANTHAYMGLIDSFRITNAVRYTTNFNPETDTYLAY